MSTPDNPVFVAPGGKLGPWVRGTKSCAPARALADRHYNRQSVGSPWICPPGRSLVLVSADRRALWVSLAQEFSDHDYPGAWLCSTFRNESPALSSDLIRAAVARTVEAWGPIPREGFVTFVDPAAVRSSNPGFCYLAAGWKREARTTRGGLVVLTLGRAA